MSTNGQSIAITRIRGRGVPVRGNDIDTDQIVPARFLREVTFDNMGRYAFFDLRRHDDGTPNDHPFNRYVGARLLVVNKNFGCGSSREHAPQALKRWGIRGIIGESFAEIFAGNCLALGLPTATLDKAAVEHLMTHIEENPSEELTLDIETKTISLGDESFPVTINPSHKEALLYGLWDTIAIMHGAMEVVERTRQRLPYLNTWQ